MSFSRLRGVEIEACRHREAMYVITDERGFNGTSS